MTWSLRYVGEAVLSEPTLRVLGPEDIPSDLIPFMERVLVRYNGAGIAAPQVGSALRIAIVTAAELAPSAELSVRGTLLINPTIVARSGDAVSDIEGCLSIPGFFTSVRRHAGVALHWLDSAFNEHTQQLTGFSARVVQHEVDHLEGRLLTDGLSRQQRRQAARAVEKVVGFAPNIPIRGREAA